MYRTYEDPYKLEEQLKELKEEYSNAVKLNTDEDTLISLSCNIAELEERESTLHGRMMKNNSFKKGKVNGMNVLLINENYALIDMENQYAVVSGYNPYAPEGQKWDYGTYFTHWNQSKEDKQQALASALELFRLRTETNYICRHRLEEIATKYKDALVDNTTEEETVEYSINELDMDDEELTFFGLPTEIENDWWD